MKFRLSFDRLEGDAKNIAVLLTDDGTALNVPARLLPAGSKPGDVLRGSLERDPAATRRLAEQTRAVQRDLRKTDPGGDIKL